MFIHLNKKDSLELLAGEQYSILDNQLDGIQTRNFVIPKNTKIDYILLVSGGEHSINIDLTGNLGVLDLRVLFLGKKSSTLSSEIKVNISASHCDVNFYTVGLLAEDSSINFDGGIVINSGVVGSEGHLLEENIILGKNVKIKTLPLLDVHSSDIKASHGARIHRLNKEKLFYLQSKGVKSEDAKKIFVEAYINKVFEKFEDITNNNNSNNINIEKLKTDILAQIIL